MKRMNIEWIEWGEGPESLELRYEIYIAIPPHLAMIVVYTWKFSFANFVC